MAKNGLHRRTNFEQLTPNIAERVVHSNCKQKWLPEFSLSVKRMGKTIFSSDSTSCMDFLYWIFPPDSRSPPDCQPAKPWSPGRQTRSLGLQDSP